MDIEPRKHSLENLALAKKVTAHYKTQYEEVKRRKEAKVKEKEEITVSNLCYLFSYVLIGLFSR